ncbi:hypothetical protein Hanom_Chr16g01492371 [Helianthus anomalus]
MKSNLKRKKSTIVIYLFEFHKMIQIQPNKANFFSVMNSTTITFPQVQKTTHNLNIFRYISQKSILHRGISFLFFNRPYHHYDYDIYKKTKIMHQMNINNNVNNKMNKNLRITLPNLSNIPSTRNNTQ